MRIIAVADTHVALWYLKGNARLSVKARRIIEDAAEAGERIGIAAISLAELVYLVEKKRVWIEAYEDLRTALLDNDHVFVEIVFDGNVADAMRQVSREEVPDMPDRIIGATGVSLGVPVISRDAKIRSSAIKTIW